MLMRMLIFMLVWAGVSGCETVQNSNRYDLSLDIAPFKPIGQQCDPAPTSTDTSECGYLPRFYCSAGGVCASACNTTADCAAGAVCVRDQADMAGDTGDMAGNAGDMAAVGECRLDAGASGSG